MIALNLIDYNTGAVFTCSVCLGQKIVSEFKTREKSRSAINYFCC
jgi:hypothetical protein